MDCQSSDPYIEKDGLFYRCSLCDSDLNSITQVRTHTHGITHRSRAALYSAQQELSAFNLTSDLPKNIERHGPVFKCVCCNLFLNSDSQIASHVAGAKHLKYASSPLPASSCATDTTCNLPLNQVQTNTYGGNYQPRLIAAPAQQNLSAFNSTSDLPEYIMRHGSGYKCACCNMPLNGASQIASHVAGAKHLKYVRSPVPAPGCATETGNETSSDLPPYIDVCGDQYKCRCCNTMLNSSFQLKSHVSGAKHIKAKLFYDKNLGSEKSGLKEKTKENVEKCFDLYSTLEEINPEDLMENVKIFNEDEEIIF